MSAAELDCTSGSLPTWWPSEKPYIIGDALTGLKQLPDGVIHCCVTSPPYWGLRDYGVEGQYGLEETPEMYVAKMMELFHEVKRVLRDDGTLWLNLGDSFASGKGTCYNPGGGETSLGQDRKAENVHPLDRGNKSTLALSGLKPKDLVGIPWRVAFALQADGWYLRSDIIWAKPNPMPESVTDRPTKAHEYVFLLAKSQKYYYDADAIKEPVAYATVARAGAVNNAKARKDGGSAENQCGLTPQQQTNWYSKIDEKSSRNKRSVWTVTTKPYSEAHFATYPPDLIEPMIKAGCPKGGIVLDPFLGSGTTGEVARNLNRYCIGYELNPKYEPLIIKRMMADIPRLETWSNKYPIANLQSADTAASNRK